MIPGDPEGWIEALYFESMFGDPFAIIEIDPWILEEAKRRLRLEVVWERAGLIVVQRQDGMYGLVEVGLAGFPTKWIVSPFLEGAYSVSEDGDYTIKKTDLLGMSIELVVGNNADNRVLEALEKIASWKVNVWEKR